MSLARPDEPEIMSAGTYLTDGLPKRYAKAQVPLEEGERVELTHWGWQQQAVILTDKRLVVVRPKSSEAEVGSIELGRITDASVTIEMPIMYWLAALYFTIAAGLGLLLIAWALLTRRLRIGYKTRAGADVKLLLNVKEPSSWANLITTRIK